MAKQTKRQKAVAAAVGTACLAADAERTITVARRIVRNQAIGVDEFQRLFAHVIWLYGIARGGDQRAEHFVF